MSQVKYTMTGNEGKLYIVANGFLLAYAERFTAILTENRKIVSLRGQVLSMPGSCTAKIILRGLSSPDPDVVREVLKQLSDMKPLDLVFTGFYKGKDGINRKVTFSRLVPVNGDLDDFIDGYVNDWEFDIMLITDETVNEFKQAI